MEEIKRIVNSRNMFGKNKPTYNIEVEGAVGGLEIKPPGTTLRIGTQDHDNIPMFSGICDYDKGYLGAGITEDKKIILLYWDNKDDLFNKTLSANKSRIIDSINVDGDECLGLPGNIDNMHISLCIYHNEIVLLLTNGLKTAKGNAYILDIRLQSMDADIKSITVIRKEDFAANTNETLNIATTGSPIIVNDVIIKLFGWGKFEGVYLRQVSFIYRFKAGKWEMVQQIGTGSGFGLMVKACTPLFIGGLLSIPTTWGYGATDLHQATDPVNGTFTRTKEDLSHREFGAGDQVYNVGKQLMVVQSSGGHVYTLGNSNESFFNRSSWVKQNHNMVFHLYFAGLVENGNKIGLVYSHRWESKGASYFVTGTKDYKKILFDITNINISHQKGMTGNASIELVNTAGMYAPDGGVYPKMFFPNKKITIYQGYGNHIVKTFTGLIDGVQMATYPHTIRVNMRDMLKLAKDNTITKNGSHVVRYKNKKVSEIWTELANLCGLDVGVVIPCDIEVTDKTFKWESYLDAFTWLEELAGYQTYTTPDGKVHFEPDGLPKSMTLAYEFIEGVNITALDYTIDDLDLYHTVIAFGEDAKGKAISFKKDYAARNYYNIPKNKILRIDVPETSTLKELEKIVDNALYIMGTRARTVNFAAIGVPFLKIGDFIRVKEHSTTVSEIYRITDISHDQNAESYTSNITCYHHGENIDSEDIPTTGGYE